MKIFYVTFKSQHEARGIGRALVERSLAVGCNWFQTACIYRSAGTVVEEREAVLLVKTQIGYRGEIEDVIRQLNSYTNCIAEIAPDSVNAAFRSCLDPQRSYRRPTPFPFALTRLLRACRRLR